MVGAAAGVGGAGAAGGSGATTGAGASGSTGAADKGGVTPWRALGAASASFPVAWGRWDPDPAQPGRAHARANTRTSTRSLMAWARILCAPQRACQTRDFLHDKGLSLPRLLFRHARHLSPGQGFLRELLVRKDFAPGIDRRRTVGIPGAAGTGRPGAGICPGWTPAGICPGWMPGGAGGAEPPRRLGSRRDVAGSLSAGRRRPGRILWCAQRHIDLGTREKKRQPVGPDGFHHAAGETLVLPDFSRPPLLCPFLEIGGLFARR